MGDRRVNPEVFAGADTGTAREATPPADVEIGASFSAKSLKHLERPRARAWAETGDDGEALDETVRENLPPRVKPGHAYRHVRFRRTVGVRLATEEASDDGD